MDEEKENQKRGQNIYIPLEGLKRWRRSTFKPSTRRSLMIPDEDQVPESLSSDRDVKHLAKYSAPNQGPTVSHQETGGILSHGKQTEDIFSNVRNLNYLRRRSGCTPSQGRSGRVNEKCFNAEVMRQEQSYISYISNRLRCIDDNLPSPGAFMNTCGERQDKMDSTESFYPGGSQQKTNHLLLQRLQYAENMLPEHNNHYNLRSSARPESRNPFHSSGISTQFGNSNQNLMYKEDRIDRERESGSNRKENIETRRRRNSNDRVEEEMESGSVKQKYRDNWMSATTSGTTQSKDFKHTRDQEEVQFNSTSKASLHESSARPKDDIIRKHATPYHSEFRKRQERLEKFRHIYERRQLALRSSGKTSKAKMTPLRNTLKRRAGEILYRSARDDMKRQRGTEDVKHSVREKSAKSKATQDTAASSQQCCRALQFESGDEEGSNDDTAPLAMVDATSVISCTSVLQGHEPKTEPGRVHPPTIKDNLLALPNAKIELKNRNIKVIREVASSRELHRNGNQAEYENFSTNMAALEEELSQNEADMLNNEDNKVQAGTSANKKALLKEKLTKAVGFSVDEAASQNVNSSRHNPSVKNLSSRRRSALVQRPLTPTRHYSSKGQRAVSSTAKLPVTRASKIGAGLGRPELRRRVNNTRRSLRRFGITEDSFEGPQCQGTPTIVLTEPSPPRFESHPERTVKPVKTSDASTNTTIRVLQSRSPRNLNVMKEIDDLVKQHEEIGKKIEEIKERTLSRRKRMKETGILESFETSISPLKRLKVMLKDKGSTRSVATSVEMDSQSAVNKSFQNVSLNLSTTQCFSADTSLENCSSLNTTCNLNASQSHWNHLKLENRFLRTPSNPSMRKVPPSRTSGQKGKEEEESFRELQPQELSPMVASVGGDGERPSLAPMTPHSRKQVSLLKLSLRKQLEQLYDDKLVT